jgi:hypothetical protein
LFNEQWPIVFAALVFADGFFAREGFADESQAFVAVLAFFVGGKEDWESEDEGGDAGRLLLLVLTSARGRFFVTKASIVRMWFSIG